MILLLEILAVGYGPLPLPRCFPAGILLLLLLLMSKPRPKPWARLGQVTKLSADEALICKAQILNPLRKKTLPHHGKEDQV